MSKRENQILVIFGASGDLTFRKLIPAIYDLYQRNFLPECFAVLGVSRTQFSDEDFRNKVIFNNAEIQKQKNLDQDALAAFSKKLYYQAIDTKSEESYGDLKKRLDDLNEQCNTHGNYIYYLSTPPSLYNVIPKYLAAHNLNEQNTGWKRLIVEKPFGYDLTTAKQLNKDLLQYFPEDNIYRIDHYLGKESVQNMLVTRFANGIFEPLWNRNYIDHIQITHSENMGVGDRGGYYDGSGALRDMLQNHLMQLVAFVAMEPPVEIDAKSIRNEKVKLFQSIRPIKEEEVAEYVVRGQYIASEIAGKEAIGYRETKGVPEDSKTETFVAVKFFIDNWRWADVPFYVRTGKHLPTKVAEIVIQFKTPPHHLFTENESIAGSNNQLVIRIQPNEGILLTFGMKVPGAGYKVDNVDMDFHYSDLTNAYIPTAYERLLLDCMKGDATLYARGDGVEAAWTFVQPILDAWKNNPDGIPLYGYPAGTWGPEEASALFDEGIWRFPCKNLSNSRNYCEL